MADVLAGDMRDNTIKGGGGDDMIYGGPQPKGATGAGDDSNEDMLYGEGGDDKIYGGAGDDMLDGGDGDDTLVGGGGDDTYYGGAGSDMIYADKLMMLRSMAGSLRRTLPTMILILVMSMRARKLSMTPWLSTPCLTPWWRTRMRPALGQ